MSGWMDAQPCPQLIEPRRAPSSSIATTTTSITNHHQPSPTITSITSVTEPYNPRPPHSPLLIDTLLPLFCRTHPPSN